MPAWFKDLFGFKEGTSYRTNREHFSIEEEEASGERYLICDGAPPHGRRQFLGEFETPSLGELSKRLADSGGQQEKGAEEAAGTAGASGGRSGGLTYQHLCTPVAEQGVGAVQARPTHTLVTSC